MAKFYYNMILLGKITLDDVPERYRDTVEELLTNK